MKQWLIYKHTSQKSGKSYIGLTSQDMDTRWKQHISAAKHGCQLHFARAITLYGVDNWDHEVLADGIDTLEEACQMEKYYIKKYNTFEDGYNLTIGGEGTQKDLEEFEFYNPELDIRVISNVRDLAADYGLHQGYVRYVTQKKTPYTNGWFLWEGEDKEYTTTPIYEFEHAEYGIEVGSLQYMVDKYGLSKGNLCMVAKGQRNYTKGWTIVGNQDVVTASKIPHNALVVQKIDISTEEIVAEYPSIVHAANENDVTESVIGDRCRGRCSTNDLNGYKYQFKNGDNNGITN